MGEYKLIIPQRLPSLNEYINICRHNRFSANKFKIRQDSLVGLYISVYGLAEKMLSGVVIYFTWYEKDRKRDWDNIISAKKYILDALVKAKTLQNDTQKHLIRTYDNDIKIDKYNPRVEVLIKVVGEQQGVLMEV